MAIPDDVKQQAKRAVSSKETMALISQIHGNKSPVSEAGYFHTSMVKAKTAKTAEPSSRELQPTTQERGAINSEVAEQAKAAIVRPSNPQKELFRDNDVMAQIRLMSVNGAASPLHTPKAETQRITQTIAKKMRMGQDMESFQRSMTKDDFGRDYGT